MKKDNNRRPGQRPEGNEDRKRSTRKSEPKKDFFNKEEGKRPTSKKSFEERGKWGKPGARKSQSDNRQSFKPDDKSEGEYKKVYKGRGKDEKPIHEWVPADKVSKKKTYDKKFKKPFTKAPAAERPEYNFDKLKQNHRKKDASDDIRLNKYIANSGICSRREADALIQKGDVKVNGEVIKEMGYKVKPGDKVHYKGKLINPEKPVYLLLNKPKDFITTTDDPMERKTVMNLVANACEERVFPVGRLDRNTTGLLLFTNDGELAAKLSHPSNNIKKIYQVTLDKPITQSDEKAILEGLELEDGRAEVDDMQVLSKDRTILGLEIHLGRNRIVRRIFAHLGYEVVALDRVMYAGLDKKDIPRGNYRFLTEKEVIKLKFFL
ncbi:pseudouridine synthase [Cecembia lonarensis]|uniref:Pseudouridine synthase n=1 Tax=Cecembia lonarensis (strain CCUG 58316 / KCTC 22772 / LW9) TaxID=1225176 RepID=K1LCC7_CECL9|nr:pseudouridine synthase [Cecembia lonarensis]EKB48058.1 Ribosomal large subunit pseudouridine synthase B [Cecembia lonarensis LW9]